MSAVAAYEEGVIDGMEITLSLLLGPRAQGGQPFTGPLSVEAREWAALALSRIAAEKEGHYQREGR